MALCCLNAGECSTIAVDVFVRHQGLSKAIFCEKYSKKIEQYLVKYCSGVVLSPFEDLRDISEQTLEAFPQGGVRIRLQVRNDPGTFRALADHLKSMGLPKGSVMTYSRLDQTKRIVF
jgi:hypothetical protein